MQLYSYNANNAATCIQVAGRYFNVQQHTTILLHSSLYTGTPLGGTFHSVFFDNVCVVWLHCCISSQHFPLRITSRTWSTPSLMDPTVPITYKPAPAFNAIVSAIGPVALSPPLNTFVKMPAFVLGGQGSSTNQQQSTNKRGENIAKARVPTIL